MSDAFAYLILAVGVVGFYFIFRVAAAASIRAASEDAARAFFDEHGHWPDQTPEEAEAERRELARVYTRRRARRARHDVGATPGTVPGVAPLPPSVVAERVVRLAGALAGELVGAGRLRRRRRPWRR